MGRKNPENSPVAPCYGRNGALLETYGSTYTITRVVTLLGLALKKEPVNCRSCWRNLLTPPNVVTTRNLRNANAVPTSQKNPENSPVAPSYGRNSSRGGGVIHAQLPPSQNLTNGVNRLGPKRSLLGDPNPKSRVRIRTELKGGCFSLFDGTPFNPIDLLLKGTHCLQCTLCAYVKHTTRWRSKRRHKASERAKNTSKDTSNGPVLFLEKGIFVSGPLLLITQPGPMRV